MQKLAKLVFANLAKHDLQNTAKHLETLISKIAKVAKIEKHCETVVQSLNNTGATARLLRVASHFEANTMRCHNRQPDSKGIVPISPAGNSESLPSTTMD